MGSSGKADKAGRSDSAKLSESLPGEGNSPAPSLTSELDSPRPLERVPSSTLSVSAAEEKAPAMVRCCLAGGRGRRGSASSFMLLAQAV